MNFQKAILRYGKNNLILHLAIVWLMAMLTAGGVWVNRQKQLVNEAFAAGETVNLFFWPAEVQLQEKTVTELKLDAKNNKIAFVRAEISFDPSRIKLASEISLNDKLKLPIEVSPMEAANSTGKAIIVAGLATSDRDNPPTGQFGVATMTWARVGGLTDQLDQAVINPEYSQVVNMVESDLPITAGGLLFDTDSASPVLVQSETLTFSPTADATIIRDNGEGEGRAQMNETLEADGNPVSNFMLKFRVSGIGRRKLQSAKIRLYAVSPALTGGRFYTAGADWLGEKLTWRNAPTAHELVGQLGQVKKDQWYELDMSSLITGDGVYSFRVVTESWDKAGFSSTRGTNPPQLVITVK